MFILSEMNKTLTFFVAGCLIMVNFPMSKVDFPKYILYMCKYVISSPKIGKNHDFSHLVLGL